MREAAPPSPLSTRGAALRGRMYVLGSGAGPRALHLRVPGCWLSAVGDRCVRRGCLPCTCPTSADRYLLAVLVPCVSMGCCSQVSVNCARCARRCHSCNFAMLFFTCLVCAASSSRQEDATAAICIAGQHRTFSATSITFARNFLHPTYTFFLSIGEEEQLDMAAAQRLSLTADRIARTACTPPHVRKGAASPCLNPSIGWNYVQIVCQAIKIGACAPLIEHHAAITGRAFKYVAHVRTDHRWLQPVPHVGWLWQHHALHHRSDYRVLAWDDHIHISTFDDGLRLFRAAPLAYSMCAGPGLWAAACNTSVSDVQKRMDASRFPVRSPWHGQCHRPNADPEGSTWTCACVSIDLWFFIAFNAVGKVRDCGGIWSLRCGLTMVDVPPHRAYASLGGKVAKPQPISISAWNHLNVTLTELMSGH